ncbi:hypothetical protein E4T50_16443 [Aureobasidium sp. EXF-12298]|nr:hypothetical protein E4T50_16443 [Aureobasidium sp. EXF-12298]
MDGYGLVSSDPPWKWVVEKPCFVSWSDKEEGSSCLGQLSPLNSTSKLTINIGWRHPRDFFMIIPCDFDTSIIDTTFAPVQSDERLESAGLGDCNLFRIPFQLAMPCDVVMPRAKRQKPVKGTPRELMSRLKSLSETFSFDVYFRFDTYAQLELRKIFDSLAMNQLNSPALLLDSMYDGRGGGVNLWLNQGLNLEPDNKRYEPHPESPQKEIPAPPPYSQDIIPSLDLNKIRSPVPHVDVQVPHSDAGVASVPRTTDSDGEGVPETPFWARMQRILDYKSPSIEDFGRGTFKRAASVDSLPSARHRKQIRACRSPMLEPSVRKASAPVIIQVDKATAVTHHEVTPPHDKSRKTASPRREPLIRDDSAPLPAGFDKVVTVANHDAASSRDRAEEIARWLYSAWSVLPSAHHILRPQLLALGAAQNLDSFAKVRIECSTKLALVAARAPKSEPCKLLLIGTSDAEEQVREVVQWVNGVRSDADIALVHELAALAGAAMDVVDSFLEKEEKMGRFLVQKARCIAFACVL